LFGYGSLPDRTHTWNNNNTNINNNNLVEVSTNMYCLSINV